MNNDELQTLCWPTSRIGEALEILARRSGLSPRNAGVVREPWLSDASREDLNEWLDTVAAGISVEAVPTHASYADLEGVVRNCAPAILRLEFGEEQLFLLVTSRRWRGLEVLAPDLTSRTVAAPTIRDILCAPVESPLFDEVNRLLDDAGVIERKRSMVRSCILRERLNSTRVELGWIVRHRASRGLADQARESGIPIRLFGFIAAHTAEYLLTIASWWIIGRGALEGRLDFGWLSGWVLLLVTRIPVKLASAWWQGLVAIRAATLLKRRLLAGALRLNPERVRSEGTGQLLGRVIESGALESMALNGALTGIVAVVEIVIAAAILLLAANSLLLCAVLFAWTAILGWLIWRYTIPRKHWTEKRVEITNDLVERMAGHRTRLAQEPRSQWHKSEDESLERYLHASRKLDRSLIPLSAVVPRGWIISALICIGYSFISGASTPTALAIAFGGILLADGALRRLTASLAYISAALIAWQQVKPLYEAAEHEEEFGVGHLGDSTSGGQASPYVEVREVSHTYGSRAEKALNGCSMRISAGDKILLEGPSGGGKSTLVSLITGLRKPDSGLVTVGGLDYKTLGSRAWRRAVAAAPQFHENHIFSNTLAFNLLVGRRWPPLPEDFEEAETICRELGLGDLLDGMPAGLLQLVGETGWQLSYGERSRVFVARALLQRSRVVVLDESFGSLDAETLQTAVQCARRRCSSLVVIAHP